MAKFTIYTKFFFLNNFKNKVEIGNFGLALCPTAYDGTPSGKIHDLYKVFGIILFQGPALLTYPLSRSAYLPSDPLPF